MGSTGGSDGGGAAGAGTRGAFSLLLGGLRDHAGSRCRNCTNEDFTNAKFGLGCHLRTAHSLVPPKHSRTYNVNDGVKISVAVDA